MIDNALQNHVEGRWGCLRTVPTVAVGSIVEGIVKGITHFGAFVELPDGRTGLVHISEVAHAYVREVREHLSEDDRVQVKVLSDDGRRIALSIKQAAPEPRPRERRPPRSLDDMLARFLKDSEERLATLRRREGSRAGGRSTGSRRDLD